MEGRSKTTKSLYCLGCLCTATEYKIHDYKIQYAHFWAIFEVNTLNLCCLCKRIAHHAETFIQNVQSNQILLQNCLGDLESTIEEARSQFQPSIILSHAPLDPITLPENDNIVTLAEDKTDSKTTSQESKVHERNNRDLSKIATIDENGVYEHDVGNESDDAIAMQKQNIKVELKVEEVLDHINGAYDDDSDVLQDPYIKEEDDYPLHLLKKEIHIEAVHVKHLKPLGKKDRIQRERKKVKKMVRKTKEMLHNEALGIKKILITREECLEERKQQALDQVYLNCAYKCEDCLKGFYFKAAYDNHLKRHSEEMGAFKCEICKLRMDSQDKFSSHKKCHTIRFQCTECGIVRTSRSTLLDHHNAIHKQGDIQFACPYCPKTFKRQMSQRKHIRYTHQNKERVTCAFCQKTYANKEVIKSHMMAQHPKEVAAIEPAKKYPCEECGLLFRSPTHLRMHGYKHSLSRDYYCVECDKAFKSEAVLKQHLKTAQPHINYSDLPLCCDQCEKRFAIRRDLDRHMNSVHLEVKPFKCDKCDKAYVSNWSLQDHKRHVHEGYKRPLRYPCKFCDKIFDRSSILKAHVRTHTGERPYQCDKCPAQFSQSGVLATHDKLIHQRLTRDGKPKHNANKDG